MLAQAAAEAQAKIIATLPDRVQRQAIQAVSRSYRYEQRKPLRRIYRSCVRPPGKNAPLTSPTAMCRAPLQTDGSGRLARCFSTVR